MNGKRLFWYSMGLKFMIIFFVIALAWGHKLISQKWFDAAVSDADKLEAVKAVGFDRFNRDNINARNQLGFTGLMVAAEQCNLPLFQNFMWRGANVTAVSYDKPTSDGKPVPKRMLKTTVIHIAIQSAEVNSQAEINILQFLFNLLHTRQKEGRETVDIKSLVNAKDASGYAPIHYILLPTVLEDRAKILDLILAEGADFNAQNDVGDTMLHQAVRRNDRAWVRFILSTDRYRKLFKKDIKNNEGLTIKDLALKINLRDMLALICSFGFWPCADDEMRGVDTPLG